MDEPGTPADRHDAAAVPPFVDCDHGACCAAADDEAALRQAERDAAATGDVLLPSPEGRAMIRHESVVPFIVQSGPRIFLLAWEQGVWVLAELQFDEEHVTFIETRRSTYDWPREAFGTLLSRVALREVDRASIDGVARDFQYWLGGQFIAG